MLERGPAMLGSLVGVPWGQLAIIEVVAHIDRGAHDMSDDEVRTVLRGQLDREVERLCGRLQPVGRKEDSVHGPVRTSV
jgi:hypothetical protein